jgi:stress response protein YsnF
VTSKAASSSDRSQDRELEQQSVVPVVAEQAVVSKRQIVSERTRITVSTEAHEELVEHSLTTTDVAIERRPVGHVFGPGESLPGVRTEGDVTVIPVFEEVLVVETRLQLKEELRIRQQAKRELVSTPVVLRRQHVEIDRSVPDQGPDQETQQDRKKP